MALGGSGGFILISLNSSQADLRQGNVGGSRRPKAAIRSKGRNGRGLRSAEVSRRDSITSPAQTKSPVCSAAKCRIFVAGLSSAALQKRAVQR